ncbi:DUF3052 domain-containing protein [Streptomyces sp. NBC_00829]|uniref:DUF3052 domain-containing protein n=1 Tax=Streptomyces sp. NBC_00829 TaxID=2903679 RepID=UPI003863C817|nr:DUF3052 domain-containing protein [Streptomyces sp. NBC_00829]
MTASGYSGTPLAKKLGIKPGGRVALRHRPPGWALLDLPQGVTVGERASRDADVTVAFYRTHDDLAADAGTLVEQLGDRAMFWIAWPRKAAGHRSDIAENDLRELFLPLGVVDVKVAALGEDWSGLKFVRRVGNRSQ